MIEECRGKSNNEGLKNERLTTLETRRFRVAMLNVIKQSVQCMKTRGHSLTLFNEKVNRNLKFSFVNRVIEY